MAHHPTKNNEDNPRGGGAWESNIRLSINLKKMDATTAQKFGLTAEDAHDRAFILTTYDNYGGKNIAYFYKDKDTGVPRQIIPQREAGKLVQQWLLESLKQYGSVSKRNLTQNRQGKDATVAEMMQSYPDVFGSKTKLISAAVEALLEDGQIFEVKQGREVLLTVEPPETGSSTQDSIAEPTPPPTDKPELKLTRTRRRRSMKRRDLRGDAVNDH
jgi:hypothetical protein